MTLDVTQGGSEGTQRAGGGAMQWDLGGGAVALHAAARVVLISLPR
jgi:hypothetical protein